MLASLTNDFYPSWAEMVELSLQLNGIWLNTVLALVLLFLT